MMRDVSINISVKFTQPRVDHRGQPLPAVALDEGNLEPNINISLDIPQEDEVLARSVTPTRILQIDDNGPDQLDFPAALLRSGSERNTRTLQYNRHNFKSKDFKSETAPSSSKHIRGGSGRWESLTDNGNDTNPGISSISSGSTSDKMDADGYSDGSLTPIPDSPPPRKKGKGRTSHVKPLSGKKAQQSSHDREEMVQSNSRSDGSVLLQAPHLRPQKSKSTPAQAAELHEFQIARYPNQHPNDVPFSNSKYITPSRFEEIYLQRADEMRVEHSQYARAGMGYTRPTEYVPGDLGGPQAISINDYESEDKAAPSQHEKARVSEPRSLTFVPSNDTPMNQSPSVTSEQTAHKETSANGGATSTRQPSPLPPVDSSFDGMRPSSPMRSMGMDGPSQYKKAKVSEPQSLTLVPSSETPMNQFLPVTSDQTATKDAAANGESSSTRQLSPSPPVESSYDTPINQSPPVTSEQIAHKDASANGGTTSTRHPSPSPLDSPSDVMRSSSRLKSTGMNRRNSSSRRVSMYDEGSPEPPLKNGPAQFEKITLRLPGLSKNGAVNESLKIVSNSRSPPRGSNNRSSHPHGWDPSTSAQKPDESADYAARKYFMFKNSTPESYRSGSSNKRKWKVGSVQPSPSAQSGITMKQALTQIRDQQPAPDDEQLRELAEEQVKEKGACNISEVAKEARALHIFDPIPKLSLEEICQTTQEARPPPSPKKESGYSLPEYGSTWTIPPRYDDHFAANFNEQLERRLEFMNLSRWYPSFVPVANNPMTVADLVTYFENISIEGLYRNTMSIPIYKSFFGDGYLVEKTLHRKVLLTITDHCMLIMDTTATIAKIWRVIPFYLITDLELRDDPQDLPLITFKIDPRDELSNSISTNKIFLNPNDDWVSFFVDNKDPNFYEIPLKYWTYKLRRVMELKRRPIDPIPLIDAVGLYGRFKNGELKPAIYRIKSPANSALYAGAKFDRMTQKVIFSANNKLHRKSDSAIEPEVQPYTGRHSIATETAPERTESAHALPPNANTLHSNEMINIGDSDCSEQAEQDGKDKPEQNIV